MSFATKVVSFDHAFRYSRGGSFDHASSIVLCEPGYLNQRTFHQMRVYATMAEKGILDWVSNRPPQPVVAPVEGGEKKEATIDALETLRFGLPADKYMELVEYVQRTLSGATSMAWVGSDVGADPKERYALNHESWSSMSSMDDIEKVISEFAGFFLGRGSPKPSSTTETAVGSISQSVPVAVVKEPLPLRKR